ncbi:MAG: hypothetical protein K0R75_2443 [Paenibacillaceae bacterium]|jgi:uncharacterized membrane protein required for colicin V production|nr:hypothetical protein [Paenibacillaceae bacterium]
MNTLDWCVVAVVAGGIFLGYRRGLVGQLVSIAGLLAGYIIAYMYYDDVAAVIAPWIPWPTSASDSSNSMFGMAFTGLNLAKYLNNTISFILLFFVVKIACTVVGSIIGMVFKAPGLNFINRWSGALLGLGEAVLLVGLALFLIGVFPSQPLQKQIETSKTVQLLNEYIPLLDGSTDGRFPLPKKSNQIQARLSRDSHHSIG